MKEKIKNFLNSLKKKFKIQKTEDLKEEVEPKGKPRVFSSKDLWD